ncbi:hypothetical protein ACQP1G_22610 [Nocardia sp. CA-107356]|uniref:hypothetical protein n=1 Tax=Nocardia sp. CA-107356 TaxID=3239972 RepID=UPI003D8D7419
MIRYPDRSIIDTLFPTMIERRRGAETTAPALVHVWGFMGTGEPGDASAAGVAEFWSDSAPTTAGSPILDIAGRMMSGMGGQLWGFGLACRITANLVVREIRNPPEVTTAAKPDEPRDGSNAEEVWVATIFDARGGEYTRMQYVHLPDLEPITWDSDTLDKRSTTRDWMDRVENGIISAHIWAAALTLDANRNRSVLQQLERRLLR